jgi:hypothetical protein
MGCEISRLFEAVQRIMDAPIPRKQDSVPQRIEAGFHSICQKAGRLMENGRQVSQNTIAFHEILD